MIRLSVWGMKVIEAGVGMTVGFVVTTIVLAACS